MNAIEYKMIKVCMKKNVINENIFDSKLLRMWENDLIKLMWFQNNASIMKWISN